MSHEIDKKVKYAFDDPFYIVQEYGVDPSCSHIYLMGEKEYIHNLQDGDTSEPGVEFLMANKFIKNMNMLMRMRPDSPILIHLKSCGGDWTEGMAIHNMIKACPNPVAILNYTHARSMSSLIFQAGNKRIMMPDSYFMFHDGTYATAGTVKQVKSDIDFSLKTESRMIEIYVDSMKEKGKFKHKSRKFIENWLREQMDKKEDVYLTAKEAVAYGLADEIFGEDGKYDWGTLTQFDKTQLERG